MDRGHQRGLGGSGVDRGQWDGGRQRRWRGAVAWTGEQQSGLEDSEVDWGVVG